MEILRKNKVLITLFALFMGLCAMLGIFATAPRSASADTSSLNFIEEEPLDPSSRLLSGGLYRIRKMSGEPFSGSEEIRFYSDDGYSALFVGVSSGYLYHECYNSSCGQSVKISNIFDYAYDYEYIDISIPGQYRCFCGKASSPSTSYNFSGLSYYVTHLIPDVDLSSVSQFYSSKDDLVGGLWVKMNLDEFYQEADGSYYIDCKVTLRLLNESSTSTFDTVLRIRVSDVFCVFIDTYAYINNFDLTEMQPITKYVVMEDSVAFYIPESYVSFEINEKVVDSPSDSPNDNDENGTQNGENNDGHVEDENSNLFSDLSSLFKTILLISSFVTIFVVLYSLFRRLKKRRSKK